MTKPNRIKNYDNILPVIELYRCLQGEGLRTGTPSFIIRTTGCTHRCYFHSNGGWCDTWYSSIHPIKGKFCFNDIIKMFDSFPNIKDVIITGGSPTMHPHILNELTHIAKARDMFITLETEGSHAVNTDFPIDLISLSPKFSNSVPKIGMKTPKNKTVDNKLINQHNKYRLNIDILKSLITHHKDYQIKPVCDGSKLNIKEIKSLIKLLDIPKEKIYLMPAANERNELIKKYPIIMEIALNEGFNFCGRNQIIAYDKRIEV